MENLFNTLDKAPVFRSKSVADTKKFGKDLSAKLLAGEVLAISGEFGAGKTHLLKAVCKSFGVAENEVTSPSFTLIHEYRAAEKLIVHLDAYRLGSDDEYELLDIDEYMNNGAYVLMEWADKVAHLLPAEKTHLVKIIVTGEFSRDIFYQKG